jgi:hypothetical protein
MNDTRVKTKDEVLDVEALKKAASFDDLFEEFMSDKETTVKLKDMLKAIAESDYDPMQDYPFEDVEERGKAWDRIPQTPYVPAMAPPLGIELKSIAQQREEQEAAENLIKANRNNLDWSSFEIGDSLEKDDIHIGAIKAKLVAWKKLNNVPNFEITFEKIGNKSYRVTRVS